jgi:inner membrane protein
MRLAFKILTVAALTLALLLPLTMVRETVHDRQQHQKAAVDTVARSTAGAQTIAGPVLYVPYVDRITVLEAPAGGVPRPILREKSGTWVYFPGTLDVRGTLRPTPRRLGLHEVRLYELDARVRASFRVQIPVDEDPASPRTIGTPRLGFGISDVRGLVGVPALSVDGRPRTLRQGTGSAEGSGLHATLETPAAGTMVTFDVELRAALQGTETLSIVPVAGRNDILLDSPWPHPQFLGDFLPRMRETSAQGFRARWEISALASTAQARLGDARTGAAGRRPADVISVSLVDPVDLYTQVDRATKYGVLFVLLTFIVFFMFEFLKQLRIHPIQYVLVGLAIASFFLLLLALSEHLSFGTSYLAAAAACVVLVGCYLQSVLGGWRRGLGVAALLGTLYGALYGVLSSEDNALLMGAGLLFIVLSALMLLTRKVDWYRAAAGTGAPPP